MQHSPLCTIEPQAREKRFIHSKQKKNTENKQKFLFEWRNKWEKKDILVEQGKIWTAQRVSSKMHVQWTSQVCPNVCSGYAPCSLLSGICVWAKHANHTFYFFFFFFFKFQQQSIAMRSYNVYGELAYAFAGTRAYCRETNQLAAMHHTNHSFWARLNIASAEWEILHAKHCLVLEFS